MDKTPKIVECPRDAMQGIEKFIPTSQKVEYLNQLLKVGFNTLDFGSFVSPKAIPQMADTAGVLEKLDLAGTRTQLLAIVANARGAEEASRYAQIAYLGFPLSISETFQKRNTNKSIAEALNALEEIKNICLRNNKKLVTYISMGFGNPYGDPYDVGLVTQFADILITLGADILSLADTIGVGESASIESLFRSVSEEFTEAEIGVHLHSTADTSRGKVEAAYRGGCRRFDGALRGFGGCPMAKDDLVGNIATETIIAFLDKEGIQLTLDREALSEAMQMADAVFGARA